MDPRQKADLVRMKRKFMHGATVAIGDGGNDVQMLAAAEIGVAIVRHDKGSSRRVQTMASLVGDASIARFAFLPRLLQVQGATAAYRFHGMLQLSLTRSVMQASALIVLAAFAQFSAADFMPFPLTLVFNFLIVSLLLLGFVTLERPMAGHAKACTFGPPPRALDNDKAWHRLSRHLRQVAKHSYSESARTVAMALAQGVLCVMPFVLSTDQPSSSRLGSLVWLQIAVVSQIIFALRQRMWTLLMLLAHVLVVTVVAGVVSFLTQQFEFEFGWSDNVQQVSYVSEAPLGGLSIGVTLLAVLLGTMVMTMPLWASLNLHMFSAHGSLSNLLPPRAEKVPLARQDTELQSIPSERPTPRHASQDSAAELGIVATDQSIAGGPSEVSVDNLAGIRNLDSRFEPAMPPSRRTAIRACHHLCACVLR